MLRVGVALRRSELIPALGVGTQLLDWVTENGNGAGDDLRPSADLREVDLLLGFRRDTRDRAVFPNAGVLHALSLTAALPGSDVEYALADYRVSAFKPVGRQSTLRVMGRLGYGRAYGDST